MNTKLPFFLLTSALVSVGAGCTFPSRGTIYDRGSVGRSMTVETGDVVSVHEVEVSGRSTIVGTGGGGLMGRAATTNVGSGVGGAVASAAGTVGGAILGEAVEEVSTRKKAQEVMVKMGNGDTVAVVQQIGTDGAFAVGEHVQVMQGGGGMTLRRLY